jgi:parallel beta-helix repeat protein
MQRKVVAVWVSLLIMVSPIVILVEIAELVEAPTTLYVGGAGGGNYSKIQWAIDNASDGDSVFVYSGSYTEYVEIDKCLNLTGENKENTSIIGGGMDNAVTIYADWVNVTGFTISSGQEGVRLSFASNCRITGNIITNNTDGIRLRWASNNIISNNEISSNIIYGINSYPSSSDNTIKNNHVISNDDSGISIDDSSNNNILINNTISFNVHHGIILTNSLQNKIIGNFISDSNYGILSQSSTSNITGNDVSSNKWGVFFYSSSHQNSVTNNNLYSNKNYGIYLTDSSNDNTFHHNNIINNTNQVYLDFSCSNTNWDDSQDEGNFWSDYSGLDDGSGGRTKGDGVGDTEIPHPDIDQGNGYFQLDNYPLMDPVGDYIFLYEGWNLVSVPFLQSNTNIGSVLSSISGSYNAVQWFNINDINDPWKHNHTSKLPQMNDLDDIDHAKGFWIQVTEPGEILFEYHGTESSVNQTIQLYEGWNMVGYPSLSSHNRTVGLNNLQFNTVIDCIQWYDAATKAWHEMGSDDSFVPGRGYWAHSKVDAGWEVPL